MVRQKLSPAVNSLPCSGYPTGTRATQDEDHCRPWGRVTIVQNGGFGGSRVNYPKWARVWKQWSTSILKRGLHSGCWNEHSNLRLQVLGSMLCQDGRQQARLEIAVNPVGHLRHYQSWLWQSLLGSLSDGKSEAENRTGFKLVLKSASGRSRPLKGLGKSSSASPNLWVRSFACVAKRGCQDVWLLHQLHQAQTFQAGFLWVPGAKTNKVASHTGCHAILGGVAKGFQHTWQDLWILKPGQWTTVDQRRCCKKFIGGFFPKVQVQWQGDGMSMLFFVTITGFNCFIPLVGAWWRYSIQDFLQKSSALDWENKKVRQLCTEAWLPQSN